MVDFETVEGTLYVAEQPQDNNEYTPDNENLHPCAIFECEAFTVTFFDGMGMHYVVTDEHIHSEEVGDVYYPHMNEAVAELSTHVNTNNVEVFRENVLLKYTIVNGDVYINSQNEITAYGGTYCIKNEELYKIVDSLLTTPQTASERDELLDIDPVTEPVHVQNVESEYVSPVECDQVQEMVKNEVMNGALKLREPTDSIRKLTQRL